MKNLATLLASRKKDKNRRKQQFSDILEDSRLFSRDIGLRQPPIEVQSKYAPLTSRHPRMPLSHPYHGSVSEVPRPLDFYSVDLGHGSTAITELSEYRDDPRHKTRAGSPLGSCSKLSQDSEVLQEPFSSKARQRVKSLKSLENNGKPQASSTNVLELLPPMRVIPASGLNISRQVYSSHLNASSTTGHAPGLSKDVSYAPHPNGSLLPLSLGSAERLQPPTFETAAPTGHSNLQIPGERSIPELEKTWARFLNETQEDIQILSCKSSSTLSTLPSTTGAASQFTQHEHAVLRGLHRPDETQASGSAWSASDRHTSYAHKPTTRLQLHQDFSQDFPQSSIMTPPITPAELAHIPLILENGLDPTNDTEAIEDEEDGGIQASATYTTMNSASSLPYLQPSPTRSRTNTSLSSISAAGSIYSTAASEFSLSMFPAPPGHFLGFEDRRGHSNEGTIFQKTSSPRLLTPPTPDTPTFGPAPHATRGTLLPSIRIPAAQYESTTGESDVSTAYMECSSSADTTVSSLSAWSSPDHSQDSSYATTSTSSSGDSRSIQKSMSLDQHTNLEYETAQSRSDLPEFRLTPSESWVSGCSRSSILIRHQQLLSLVGAAENANSYPSKNTRASVFLSPALDGVEWGQAI